MVSYSKVNMCIIIAIIYLIFTCRGFVSFLSLPKWIWDLHGKFYSVPPGADLLDTSTRRLFQSRGTDLLLREPKAKDREPLDFLFQRPKVTSVHCSTNFSFNLTFRKSLLAAAGPPHDQFEVCCESLSPLHPPSS